MEDFRRQAKSVAERLRSDCDSARGGSRSNSWHKHRQTDHLRPPAAASRRHTIDRVRGRTMPSRKLFSTKSFATGLELDFGALGSRSKARRLAWQLQSQTFDEQLGVGGRLRVAGQWRLLFSEIASVRLLDIFTA